MTSFSSRRLRANARNSPNWYAKRWKTCISWPCRWKWKSASDLTGATWSELAEFPQCAELVTFRNTEPSIFFACKVVQFDGLMLSVLSVSCFLLLKTGTLPLQLGLSCDMRHSSVA